MSSATRPKRPLGKRLPRLAGFLVGQGIVVLLLLELVGRLFDPLGISYYPETARFLDTMIKEEPIGYRHRPGLKGRYFGAEVEINSLGLRDAEIPLEPDPDEHRILFLGDSFVFGIGVDLEDSIPHQLEVLANENGRSERRYRTLNAGVLSYNTEQELIQLKSIGLGLRPDLVLLVFAPNDGEPKMWVFDKRSSLVADLAQRSYAASLLFTLRRQFRERYRNELPAFHTSDYWVASPGWLNAERSMIELNRDCREAGIPFILFVGRALAERPRTALVELGEREGFPVLVFGSPWDPADRFEYANSRVDGHPNETGSRMYAELFYEMLKERNALE